MSHMADALTLLTVLGKLWINCYSFSYLGKYTGKEKVISKSSLLESVWEVILGIIVKFRLIFFSISHKININFGWSQW